MAGFHFLFTELIQETIVLETLSKRFLEPNSKHSIFPEFLSKLRNIGGKPEKSVHCLELNCLRTIPSDQYDRKPGKEIYAIISGKWELQLWGKRSTPKRKIEFCGKASTKIELYASDDPEKRLAMWRLELGAEDSPGCYIHAQILGDCSNPPFPKWLPIPRLPSIFITPMSAIEFALAELFQRDWAQVVSSKNDNVNRWRNIQTDRLQKLFSWYNDQMKNAGSSPWLVLKEAKPESEMFLSKP